MGSGSRITWGIGAVMILIGVFALLAFWDSTPAADSGLSPTPTHALPGPVTQIVRTPTEEPTPTLPEVTGEPTPTPDEPQNERVTRETFDLLRGEGELPVVVDMEFVAAYRSLADCREEGFQPGTWASSYRMPSPCREFRVRLSSTTILEIKSTLKDGVLQYRYYLNGVQAFSEKGPVISELKTSDSAEITIRKRRDGICYSYGALTVVEVNVVDGEVTVRIPSASGWDSELRYVYFCDGDALDEYVREESEEIISCTNRFTHLPEWTLYRYYNDEHVYYLEMAVHAEGDVPEQKVVLYRAEHNSYPDEMIRLADPKYQLLSKEKEAYRDRPFIGIAWKEATQTTVIADDEYGKRTMETVYRGYDSINQQGTYVSKTTVRCRNIHIENEKLHLSFTDMIPDPDYLISTKMIYDDYATDAPELLYESYELTARLIDAHALLPSGEELWRETIRTEEGETTWERTYLDEQYFLKGLREVRTVHVYSNIVESKFYLTHVSYTEPIGYVTYRYNDDNLLLGMEWEWKWEDEPRTEVFYIYDENGRVVQSVVYKYDSSLDTVPEETVEGKVEPDMSHILAKKN
ncbi:MAG: hypothetical protein IKX54_02045 [Lachnospiraceae bacterium]|nr:hypothetical protein [Lachnospiraceae bacterium]